MLAPRTRSACLAKMFTFKAARIASRILFCWTRKPGLLPGNGAYQLPHSSTTSATFFCGSYLSMMAEYLLIRPSIVKVFLRNCAYSLSPKPRDLNLSCQRTTVYECIDSPLMSQLHVCCW